MKSLPLLLLFLFFASSTFAQCYEYQTEIQNIENKLEGFSKILKESEKASTFLDCQKIIDKAIVQAKAATESATMAKSIAQDCSCNEGAKLAETIYTIAFDAYSLVKKAVDAGNLESARELTKKAVIAAENAKSEASYGSSACND